jgi:hypothetical protein
MPSPHDIDQAVRARLLDVARAEAETRGWPWLEPIEITLTRAAVGTRQWMLRSNAAARGRNVRLTIAEPDFEVVEAAFLPR